MSRPFFVTTIFTLAGVLFAFAASGNQAFAAEPNQVILSLLPSMPVGGGYSADSSANRHLEEAVQVRNGRLQVTPSEAYPTYCSGATYLVFVRALQLLNENRPLSGTVAESLAITGQRDGVGIWGRWNANGPGTACLFRELRLGRNFTSFELAQPGDFMKIFWSNEVGRHEHGHSVIFLSTNTIGGVPSVTFWSSNLHMGYGRKSVPRSRIARAIFSRLENPGNIEFALRLPAKNDYLASLISRDSSFGEALSESGASSD